MSRLNYMASLDLLTVSPTTIFNTGALGTSAIRLDPPPPATASSPGFIRRVQITNKSSSAVLGFTLIDASTASPTNAPTASAAGAIAATDGVCILPSTPYLLNYTGRQALWLAASAASTPIQVVFFDTDAR